MMIRKTKNKPQLNMATNSISTISTCTLKISPNPATDYFQISGLVDSALITISDFNCNILLKTQISNDESISVISLKKGVYIAKIVSGGCTVERKFVKE